MQMSSWIHSTLEFKILAADVITPTISPCQQDWLTDDEFNNGYLLLLHLKELLCPVGDI